VPPSSGDSAASSCSGDWQKSRTLSFSDAEAGRAAQAKPRKLARTACSSSPSQSADDRWTLPAPPKRPSAVLGILREAAVVKEKEEQR